MNDDKEMFFSISGSILLHPRSVNTIESTAADRVQSRTCHDFFFPLLRKYESAVTAQLADRLATETSSGLRRDLLVTVVGLIPSTAPRAILVDNLQWLLAREMEGRGTKRSLLMALKERAAHIVAVILPNANSVSFLGVVFA